MSICTKGVSRGVHNITFLLSSDHFHMFDLFFFHGPSVTKGAQSMYHTSQKEVETAEYRDGKGMLERKRDIQDAFQVHIKTGPK